MAKLFNKNSFGNASDLKKGLYRNSPASVSQDSLHHSLSTGSSVAFGDDVFEDAAEVCPWQHIRMSLATIQRQDECSIVLIITPCIRAIRTLLICEMLA